MSLISRSLQTKAAIPIAQPGRYPATSFQLINGRLVGIADNKINYIEKGYNINDIVYSIINLITRKCKVAPWAMYDIVDEAAYKRLHAIYRKKSWDGNDIANIINLQRKALQPTKKPGKWGELLKYPNAHDTFTDFIGNGIGWKLLTGNKYILGQPLKAGANQGIPNELWNLPAQHVNIWCTDTFPTRITKYNVNRWPQVFYQPNEILHEKYWNPSWEINGEQLYGVAPLRAAMGLLTRNNSSLNASAKAFQNEGIKGILHMKGTPGNVEGELLVQEIDRLKDTMVNEWSGEENRGRMGLGAYDMGWLPIGLNSEEMMVIESEKWDLRRLCNVWNVNAQLLNDDQRAYNNFKEAQLSLTTGAAMPELCSTRDALNRQGERDWGMPKGQCADFDMSVYSELQADVKDTAEWTTKLLAISPNEQRELCGLAALPDTEMSEPWVQSAGRVPLSIFQMTPVDDALNDDTEENI